MSPPFDLEEVSARVSTALTKLNERLAAQGRQLSAARATAHDLNVTPNQPGSAQPRVLRFNVSSNGSTLSAIIDGKWSNPYSKDADFSRWLDGQLREFCGHLGWVL